MFIKRLIFSALFCFACVYYTPVFADDAPNVADTTNQQTDDESSLESEIIIDTDPEIDAIRDQLEEFGWCPDDDYVEPGEDDTEATDTNNDNDFNRGSDDDRKRELCKQLKELHTNESALSQNTKDLEENYQNMKDKETSFENRMLGAVGMGTVGIGGMMAASALAEQNADKKAEQDMQAYLSSFSCRYGGQSVSGGQTGVELPGGNQLIDLYTEYTTLANDLKERKTALGLKPGIESELVLDKASNGLYDDVGKGIESGAYASISRALQDPSGKDAEKLAEQKESTDKKLKIGATVAAAGAVATAAANYAINHNNKDKSAELLAQRKDIKTSFNDLSKTLIEECNQTIQEHKEFAAKLTPEQLKNDDLAQYKKDVDAAQNITSLSELWSSLFCK